MQKITSYTVLERGWLSSNSIVFAQGAQTAVVDTGYCTHAKQTLFLIRAALQNKPLHIIANTHLHSDHCGGNAMLQASYPDAQTMIPPGQSQFVTAWDQQALSYEPTGQTCPQFTFQNLLEPGQTILLGDDAWEIHAAPGHDPDSVILFEPQSRTLISADALWENGFGVVFQELEQRAAFDQVAATLDLIERLSPHTIIPGHGPAFQEITPALARARSRLDRFIQSPVAHARYGAKVLIKYKLLEWQHCDQQVLLEWIAQTPYFAILHRNFFASTPMQDWINELLNDLIRSNAIRRQAHVLLNVD
jgi:glyoxylase-like metal-dependent hydrolase (beta-lactamase superfamily II)